MFKMSMILTKKIEYSYTMRKYTCVDCGKVGFLVARGRRNRCIFCYTKYIQKKLDEVLIV